MENTQSGSLLPVKTVSKSSTPSHRGWGRRFISATAPAWAALSDSTDRLGQFLQKLANTIRFEVFWRRFIAGDDRVIVVPTFNKLDGKHPIWNCALNWLSQHGAKSGVVLEFGTNNGGWLKYFVDRSPQTLTYIGFDCFEGLPEEWDGLAAGSIKGFGAPAELWSDDPTARSKIISDAENGIPFPAPPQRNVIIETGLFTDCVPRLLKNGPLIDLRLVHFDADLYMSTRPILDMVCGRLNQKYIILFDEFYSANHEFRAWNEFVRLFALTDWRVIAISADGSQALFEVNTKSSL